FHPDHATTRRAHGLAHPDRRVADRAPDLDDVARSRDANEEIQESRAVRPRGERELVGVEGLARLELAPELLALALDPLLQLVDPPLAARISPRVLLETSCILRPGDEPDGRRSASANAGSLDREGRVRARPRRGAPRASRRRGREGRRGPRGCARPAAAA